MIKAISGGQTGADIAALDAALACGFETGGTSTFGYRNETGYHHDFGEKYGMSQIDNGPLNLSGQYRDRTRRNAGGSDVTIWFEWDVEPKSPGYLCTRKGCFDAGRNIYYYTKPHFDCSGFAARYGIKTVLRQNDVINFAGNRESRSPGIYDWVYGLLLEVFQELKAK